MLFEPTAVAPFPVRLEVDYPERLSRLSTFFRLILAIPVVILLAILAGGGAFGQTGAGAGGGITGGGVGSPAGPWSSGKRPRLSPTSSCWGSCSSASSSWSSCPGSRSSSPGATRGGGTPSSPDRCAGAPAPQRTG